VARRTCGPPVFGQVAEAAFPFERVLGLRVQHHFLAERKPVYIYIYIIALVCKRNEIQQLIFSRPFFRPEILTDFNRCGTIQDLIVSVLCNRGTPIMSTHNAASWGYFDVVDRSWNIDILDEAGFPVHLLPSVVQPGTNFGTLHQSIYGIPEGVTVGKPSKHE